MASDEPLASFVASHDEEAFRQLAERYSGMVYASALRRTGSPEAAEEIVQNVFIVLARKAPSLLRHPSLSGWLFRAAMLESANYLRRESKRCERMKAFEKHQADRHEEEGLLEIPQLDEALDRLPEADRNLLLLRFFDRQGFREIALAMGKSEVASRKQSERALAKLRRLLEARGFRISGAVLATALGAHLGGSAPAGIAALAANGAALAATSPVSAPLLPTLVGMLASTSKVVLFATVTLFLAVGGGGYYAGRQQVDVRDAQNPDPHQGQPNQAERSKRPERSSGFFPDPTLDRLRFLIRTAGTDHRLLEFRLAVSGLSEAAISDLLQYSKGKLLLRDEEDRSIYASLLSALVAVNPGAFGVHLANSPELGLSGGGGTAVLSEVLASWVLKDQKAAVAWVRGTMAVHRSTFLVAMIESIGDHDRLAAIRLFKESVSDGVIGPGKWDSGDFFREWAKDDPVGAVSEALAIRDLTKKDEALHQSVMVWSRFDPEKARQWVDEARFIDDVVRKELMVSLVNGWAENSPEAAASYLMGIEDPATQERAAHFLLRDWVAT
ncbi:MAG: sigma-70 family RNA polymerase sigma factor, partial [Verrucomicrobiota bacterium]